MKEDKKDIISLIHELENSREHALFLQLESLRSSYRVFAGNYRELISLLDVVESDNVAIPLSDVKRRKEFLQVFDEAIRRLHNFIASAKTLIDHTRTHIYRSYKGQPFVNEYKLKIKEQLASSPVQRFIQDLRNYTQHYTLPTVGRSMSWERGQDSFNIWYFINIDELRKWDKWSHESQLYMDTFEGNLSMKKLAVDYYSLIDQFYKWLDRREQEINSDKLERHQKMRKRIKSLYKKNER